MNLLITHGYLLSGSGSNVYVQNLCRSLVRLGHNIRLLCQEPEPLLYDFVSAVYSASGEGVKRLSIRETPYPGNCEMYRPEIGDLLPVYVYDDYPGWRVKTFLNLTGGEFDSYITSNADAIRAVLAAQGADAVITNHSVPGPLIARRALGSTGIPYVSIVHGSCLQYVARRNKAYMARTREGLRGAKSIVALSSHSAGTIAEDFPEMAGKTIALPGGVDTDLFRPGAPLPDLTTLSSGPGRGPDQREALRGVLRSAPGSAKELAGGLRNIATSYDPRIHDADAGARLGQLLNSSRPIIVYVGKLIASKGVHSLLTAFARMRRETEARLLIIGYGTFREALEALTQALSDGDERALQLLANSGRLFEGGPDEPLEHFTLSAELLSLAAGMEKDVEFVGPLYHEELSGILPAADVAAVPSIFPETFGLVAAEHAASGVPPFVAGHSGLREAGGIVGRELPLNLQVSLEGDFGKNLAGAIGGYLKLPEQEREKCRTAVRRASVERLGWGALAERLVKLVVD